MSDCRRGRRGGDRGRIARLGRGPEFLAANLSRVIADYLQRFERLSNEKTRSRDNAKDSDARQRENHSPNGELRPQGDQRAREAGRGEQDHAPVQTYKRVSEQGRAV